MVLGIWIQDSELGLTLLIMLLGEEPSVLVYSGALEKETPTQKLFCFQCQPLFCLANE